MEINVGDVLFHEYLGRINLSLVSKIEEEIIETLLLDSTDIPYFIGGTLAYSLPVIKLGSSGRTKFDVLTPSGAAGEISNKCKCPIFNLMNLGCKCGGI